MLKKGKTEFSARSKIAVKQNFLYNHSLGGFLVPSIVQKNVKWAYFVRCWSSDLQPSKSSYRGKFKLDQFKG